MGKAIVISSGCASRLALYSGKAICLKVGPLKSNATAKCVGFSLLIISQRVLINPEMAEVLSPLELIKGLAIKA